MKTCGYTLVGSCRSCGSGDMVPFYRVGPIPVAGLYYNDGEDPLDLRAPITAARCGACGLAQLMETIDPAIYREYSYIGISSSTYEGYLRDLAADLVGAWGLREKRVFEIGANSGEFLRFLRDMGGNEVSGIEPSRQLCGHARSRGVAVTEGYFNGAFVMEAKPGVYDCVVIRHVLEHIHELNDIVEAISEITAPGGILIAEVPDFRKVVEDRIFSNIFHEHLNYFTPSSLDVLLARHGFSAVHRRDVPVHGGSHLVICTKKGGPRPQTQPDQEAIGTFADDAGRYYAAIRERITGQTGKGRVVHGYGASHRTFIIMGNAGLDAGHIPVIYDNNRLLQGRRLNGLHSLILPKDSVSARRPDCIVIFASSYEEEIKAVLRDELNYTGEIVSVSAGLHEDGA